MDTSNIAVTLGTLPGVKSFAEAFGVSREMGFSAFALFVGGKTHSGTTWDDLDDAAHAELSALRDTMARGAVHAPFTDLPLVSPNPGIEREAMRQITNAVRVAGVLRCEVVTVHAYQSKLMPVEESMPRLVAALRTLGDVAAASGVRIGVENVLNLPTPNEQVGLIDRVDHPAVRATLDTGHTNYWFQRDSLPLLPHNDGAAWYNARLMRIMDALGDRIIHVHLQDTALPEMTDQHLPLGMGMIDLAAVLARLHARNYTGLLELEQRFTSREQVAATRDRLLAAMPMPT